MVRTRLAPVPGVVITGDMMDSRLHLNLAANLSKD